MHRTGTGTKAAPFDDALGQLQGFTQVRFSLPV